MVHIECSACRKSFPMNDTVKIEDRPLCRECASADLKALGNAEPDLSSLQRQFDPTVCAGCGADFGGSVLPTLQSGLPVCEECRKAFLNRPYPNWVKLAFACLVAVAALSMVVNWRFTAAYFEMKKATREFAAGRVETASRLMDSAARRAPESADLRDAARLYRGFSLLFLDKSAEALPYLRDYNSKHPDQAISDLVYQAETSAAFDRHDYDAFLTGAQQHLARHAGDPLAVALVSSAYACKYAASGDTSFKTESLRLLEQAKSLAGGDSTQMKEYEGRIRYRIETREVLSPTEYHRRFPNGWKGGAQ